MADLARIVITGVGVASPNGSDLAEFRANLLNGVSGVEPYNIRYVGDTFAGVCHFDPLKHQKRKELRRGTRAGSIGIYCANEALASAGIERETLNPARVGVYVGTTEHGNVETENQIHEVAQYDYDLSFWSHHHNPRTVANNPAGEITLNMGLTGPAYALGGACAGGNLGLIHGVQMLRLGEVDGALVGQDVRAERDAAAARGRVAGRLQRQPLGDAKQRRSLPARALHLLAPHQPLSLHGELRRAKPRVLRHQPHPHQHAAAGACYPQRSRLYRSCPRHGQAPDG